MGHVRSKERLVQNLFACVRTAPFGFPVVPGRVDEEEGVVVFDLARRRVGAAPVELAEADPWNRASPAASAALVLVGDDEKGRLGVVELVADLDRGEPPAQRLERRADLGAREEERDVRRVVAGQRRDAVTTA